MISFISGEKATSLLLRSDKPANFSLLSTYWIKLSETETVQQSSLSLSPTEQPYEVSVYTY